MTPGVLGAGRGRSAVAWSGASVAGRQAFQLLFALVLARVLGPEGFGVVSLATVYVTLTVLLLDLGLAAALVQRPRLPAGLAGATATANLGVAVLLGALTLLLAGPLAGFFDAPALADVLVLLAPALLVKAAAVAPRALLVRDLRLRPVAVADLLGAGAGCVAGLVALGLGAGVLSLVVQTVVLDAVAATVLLVAARGPLPNARLRLLRDSLGFSGQVLATGLVAFLSRNTDNVLVGRVLGTTALAYYGMAYRVLVLPVQLVGQTVNRVMFPAFARMADDRDQLHRTVLVATRALALAAVPAMGLAAVAAWQLVEVVLGPAWRPAAPLVAVLALAGARETVFYVTPTLAKGLGRGGTVLRFELLSTAVQVTGVVIGLAFGVLGVAVGYALAGVALVPVLLRLQHRLAGVRARETLRCVAPPLHASAWGAGAYLLVTLAGWPPVATLLLGATAYLLVLGLVLGLVHRRSTASTVRLLRGVRRGAGDGPVQEVPT
ncbi:lipopolysaccharide biosynthesis protein [Aquipuribacter nitratireducens]|uniref:Lipopolysaccharide biosynthesis protein n=1 Tax=Aquipuribacter nitratireducens TaxID=650104 RepID=A0ABW0GQV3_9MICO